MNAHTHIHTYTELVLYSICPHPHYSSRLMVWALHSRTITVTALVGHHYWQNYNRRPELGPGAGAPFYQPPSCWLSVSACLGSCAPCDYTSLGARGSRAAAPTATHPGAHPQWRAGTFHTSHGHLWTEEGGWRLVCGGRASTGVWGTVPHFSQRATNSLRLTLNYL